ncbi:acyltransferase family protein [Myroides indicus]|uniref:Acyltransferase 3 domain-containing protein n=1 Tax=Myroides indicus TaxID=1323422 RepID=A0A4R7ERX6_9FLAO|nr:acyltransferase family protein [Myroides indicus]TDS49977.1 hypothetical protein C8P70_1624 [Myroides indicus]
MNYSLELIRLIAVILITFTHTKNDFSTGITHFIFEEIPLMGTVILSLISGFLFFKISKNKNGLFQNKVKTLLTPYLFANLIVFGLVLTAQYIFDINFLNRLTFDYTLFTEGLLSLNSPPVNPPTYFIRDIFVVFVLVELIKNKNFYMLLIIIPLMIFGKLFLRIDIPLLFLAGIGIAYFSDFIIAYKKAIILALLILITALFLFQTKEIDTLKYPFSLFLFILIFNQKIKFYNVGAFSYLLHLYHAPFIVILYPILSFFITNAVLNAFMQIVLSIAFVYILYTRCAF